jgi:CubicO group peptidase (beta-lactamase class C family)
MRGGKLTTGEPLNYGYGWFVDPYKGKHRQWHAGETTGFRTAVQRFPDAKLTVIVLANRSDVDAKKLSLDLADLYLQ